jgi:hypothetical protein
LGFVLAELWSIYIVFAAQKGVAAAGIDDSEQDLYDLYISFFYCDVEDIVVVLVSHRMLVGVVVQL